MCGDESAELIELNFEGGDLFLMCFFGGSLTMILYLCVCLCVFIGLGLNLRFQF